VEKRRPHDRAVGQHGDEKVGLPRHLGDGASDLAALFEERGASGLAHVEADDAKAGPDEVFRHGQPHAPKSYEPDLAGHGGFLQALPSISSKTDWATRKLSIAAGTPQ